MTQTQVVPSPSVSWTEQLYPVAHVAGSQLLHLCTRLLEAGRSWLSSREVKISSSTPVNTESVLPASCPILLLAKIITFLVIFCNFITGVGGHD